MRSPTRRIAFALALALALAPAGCGTTNGGGLSAAARTGLAPLVRQVRQAAESHDRPGAQNALTQLQRAVASYEKDGEISPARAAEILAAAAQVQSRLGLVPTTTTTTTRPGPPGHGKNGKGDEHKGKGGDGND